MKANGSKTSSLFEKVGNITPSEFFSKGKSKFIMFYKEIWCTKVKSHQNPTKHSGVVRKPLGPGKCKDVIDHWTDCFHQRCQFVRNENFADVS